MTLGVVETNAPEFGGDDMITSLGAADIVIGGSAADTIDPGDGDDLVLGDNGRLDWVLTDSDPADLDRVISLDVSFGGVDTIHTLGGDDLVIGGAAGDVIDAGEGRNIVIGDSGQVSAATVSAPQTALGMTFSVIATIASDTGGNDSIVAGTGADIVLGGAANDTIDPGAGDNLVLGDNGSLDWVSLDGEPADLDRVMSLDPVSVAATRSPRTRATTS